MSRQREWQLRKQKEGVCSSCGDNKMFESPWCFRHYVLRLLSRYELPVLRGGNDGPLKRNRREMTIAYLAGRYTATSNDGVPPELEPAWEDIGYQSDGTGRHFKDYKSKFSAMCRALDRKAVRNYAARVAREIDNATDTSGEANNNHSTPLSN